MGYIHPRSRTMACPGAYQTVSGMIGETTAQRYVIAPRGTGAVSFDTVPSWAWWLGGGLVAGLVGGALIFRKKG
jgi:hypothetical protein